MEIKTITYRTKAAELKIYITELTDDKKALTENEISALENLLNPNRQKEYITVRTLLREVGINDTIVYYQQKPRLENNPLFISISHCQTHAAVALSEKPCGIDIETVSNRALKVQDKFQSENEKNLSKQDTFLNTLFWSAKECLFKKDNRLSNFKKDMKIFSLNETEKILEVKTPHQITKINYRVFNNLVVCWVV